MSGISRCASRLALAVLIAGQSAMTASAAMGPAPQEPAPSNVITRPEASEAPRAAADQILVKFKSEGPQALTQCAHCLLRDRRTFQSAHATGSDSLDRLNRLVGVKAARAVFRSRCGITTSQALERDRVFFRSVGRAFPVRAARATTEAAWPSLANVYVLDLPRGAKLEEICRLYRQDPAVEYAQPNYTVTTAASDPAPGDVGQAPPATNVGTYPNDPYFNSANSWGQGSDDLWGLKRIAVQDAWLRSKGAGVVVAVVDSGVDLTHPDLAANLWSNRRDRAGNWSDRCDRVSNPTIALADDDCNGLVDDVQGWDFINHDHQPQDDYGHGTHVAGTIAAVGNNSLGIIGVAPQAKIMAVKALDQNGRGPSDVLARALLYAATSGADVINASWACESRCPSNPVLEDAVRQAYGLGALVVSAAGNAHDDVVSYTPQRLPQVVTVGATTFADGHSDFSNFGVELDVAAPGGESGAPCSSLSAQNILSLRAAGTDVFANCGAGWAGSMIVGGSYYRSRGTSMAAPQVSGVAALVLSAHPSWSTAQVMQALRRGVDDLGPAGFDTQFGYGRLNANKAISEPTPLGVLLTEPAASTMTGLEFLPVRGTVSGTDLASWRVDYGTGLSPSTWTPITSSSGAVVDSLLTSWDVRTVVDNTYTVRLQATDATGRVFEDRRRVLLDQVAIAQPDASQISLFRAGELVTITGTAAPANFSRYTLRIQRSNGSYVSNPLITLPNNGAQRVYQGTLGTWNTAGISVDHYSVVLQVTLTTGATIRETARVAVDPRLHPGWPQPLGSVVVGPQVSLAVTDHLDAADVNGDGRSELIVGYGNTVRIYDHTGAMLPGWPQTVDPNGIGVIQTSPVVGDVTGDGVPEVVAANLKSNLDPFINESQIFIWRANGTPLSGWPKVFNGIGHTLAIDDLDGDGRNEIIATDWQGQIEVLSLSGQSLPGWPRQLGTGRLSPAAIGNVDGSLDGHKELAVVTLSQPSQLSLLQYNGAPMPGWETPKAINPTVPPPGFSESYPVLGDLDGDGDLEIVVGSGTGTVVAYQHTGVLLWSRPTKGVQVNSVAIGNIDGVAGMEVVAGNYPVLESGQWKDYLFAWRGDGSVLPNWPVRYPRSIGATFFGFGAAALADLDGNGTVEAIVSSDAGNLQQPFALHAVQASGAALPGFPKPTAALGAWSTDTAAVADLDGDGLLELAWIDAAGNLYVWDLTAPASAACPWPMFRHDPQHRGQASE